MPKRAENLPAVPEPISASASLPTDPAALALEAKGYADQARAANTLRAYGADWRCFSSWCERAGRETLPATAETLCAYVVALAGERAVSTIQRRISAIASAHHVAGHASPAAHPQFREVWKGIRRQHGAAAAGARPITGPELRALVDATPGSDPKSVRDRALILIGFHLAARRSELAAMTVEDVEEAAEGLRVTVRRSKTDQEGEGLAKGVMFQPDPKVCPIRALDAWLDVSRITEGPIFRSIAKGGRVKPEPIDGRTVTRVVQAAAGRAAAAGLLKSADGFSGHSLRAGLATTAAASGAPERAIAAQGGWKSTATLRRYIRPGSVFVENVGAALQL